MGRAPRSLNRGPLKDEWVEAAQANYADVNPLIGRDDIPADVREVHIRIRNRIEQLMIRAGFFNDVRPRSRGRRLGS